MSQKLPTVCIQSQTNYEPNEFIVTALIQTHKYISSNQFITLPCQFSATRDCRRLADRVHELVSSEDKVNYLAMLTVSCCSLSVVLIRISPERRFIKCGLSEPSLTFFLFILFPLEVNLRNILKMAV